MRIEQFKYLLSAAQAGMTKLLANLEQIREATRMRGKYRILLEALRDMGLDSDSKWGLPKASRIVLIQPKPELKVAVSEMFREAGVPLDVISFAEFRDHVAEHDDPLSVRFAESLTRWAMENPGYPER